jgi:hypothetical protein
VRVRAQYDLRSCPDARRRELPLTRVGFAVQLDTPMHEADDELGSGPHVPDRVHQRLRAVVAGVVVRKGEHVEAGEMRHGRESLRRAAEGVPLDRGDPARAD